MSIRLIATDVDGTLLGEGGRIPAINLEAIRAAQKRGIIVAIASGRIAEGASRLAVNNALDVPIIACNGSTVMDKPFGRRIAERFMDPTALAACLDILNAEGLAYILYAAGRVVFGGNPKSMALYERLHQDYRDGGTLRCDYGDASSQIMDCSYKLLGHDMDTELLLHTRRKIETVPGITMSSSWVSNFEVMPAGVSKGSALKAYAEELGIRPEEIMAFGDQENDLSMLMYAGHGVAMGNAMPEVKKASRYVTGTNTAGGMGRGVLRWALETEG